MFYKNITLTEFAYFSSLLPYLILFQKPQVRVTTGVLTGLYSHCSIIADLGEIYNYAAQWHQGIMLILMFIKLVGQQVWKLKNGPIQTHRQK
jgi:hypothetical protein